MEFKLEQLEVQNNGQSSLIKCASTPKQLGNTECWYYIPAYMRDIVGSGIEELQKKKITYTMRTLEKVREEWGFYVQTNFIEFVDQFSLYKLWKHVVVDT